MATVYDTATIGGGCYWCLEAIFQRIKGIESVTSGYSGGHIENPSAKRVYKGDTGHAEVIQLKFNEKIISYREILEIFFVMHDPTTLNRQGNDVGEWYRSVIFFHNNQQHDVAREMIETFASGLWPDPIVTELVPFTKFWPAEDTMQDFYNKNPRAGYCMVIIDPKIQKLRQKFAEKFIEDRE